MKKIFNFEVFKEGIQLFLSILTKKLENSNFDKSNKIKRKK